MDPRLWRYARATRPFIAASVFLGFLRAALIVAQAWLLADVVAGAFAGRGLARMGALLVALTLVAMARGAVAWGAELAAGRASTAAKRQLRDALLRRLVALGPVPGTHERTGGLATLAVRGVDALDAYFSAYLPQLLLAVIVPAVIVAVVLARDWISAAIIVFTLPLIPLFMALVGMATREKTDAQVRALQRLAAHFLDVVAGLATLKVFGRAKAQIEVIGEVSERERSLTMAALRVTFLSSLVLELLATVSVAIVAVAVGVRLLNGDLTLRTALLVLVLAPEAYLPLRQLGAAYHASAEGLAATDQVFEVLETPPPRAGRRTEIPDPAREAIAIEELTVRYPERATPALERVSLRIDPGEIVALAGPSGAGKSTLLSVLLAFLAPEHGSVRIGEAELAELDPDAWRRRISWLPQRPHVFAGSIADNIRLGCPGATERQLSDAVGAAGLADVVAARPDGLATPVGERGRGLSAGERQRVALARAFLRDAPLVLLDEPTASLDGATEAEVLAATRRLMAGRTVVLAAHRPALTALADRVVELTAVTVAA